VNLKSGLIHVRRRADRYNQFGPPKSQAGVRDVPLAPIVLNALRAWRLACPNGPLDLVFPNGAGKVENHANILERVFWPIQIAAGVCTERDGTKLARYSLHALRHAAAALWIEQGISAKKVQTWMGHAKLALTMDTYAYLFEAKDDDAAAMAGVEKRLLG
jgi:integrase